MILRCKFFELRKTKMRLLLVLLATGCATLEPPVNSESGDADKVYIEQESGDPLKVGSEGEIQASRVKIEVGESLKAEDGLIKPINGEGNAGEDFAVEEMKNSLTQQEATLTERIKSAYESQLELKERLVKDLERQLGVITSETDEKTESVNELVTLLNTTNDLLKELEREVEKYTELDDRGELINPLAKGRLAELERKVRNLQPDVSRC